MRARVVRVAELVDEVRAGCFLRDALRHVLVILRMALGHVRAGQHHFRAHRLQVEDLLAAHLVRHHEDQPVALGLRHQRQADAGVAGGAFDQGVAGFDLAGFLRRFDHRQADAILDRAAGVGAFQFQIQLAGASIEVAELDHRRVADQFEDAVVDAHAKGRGASGARPGMIARLAGRAAPEVMPGWPARSGRVRRGAGFGQVGGLFVEPFLRTGQMEFAFAVGQLHAHAEQAPARVELAVRGLFAQA